MGGRLDGRAVVVTGVSRRIGIGFAITRRLLVEGADVLAHAYRRHDEEQPWGADPAGPDGVRGALLADLPAGSGRLAHIEADFEDPAAPDSVIAAAWHAFGQVDAIVANHARSSMQSLSQLTAAELDRSFAVNVRATLLLIKAFAARHSAASGRVVLFTSGQHLEPMPAELPYIATKGALQQLTGSLAAELRNRGITVNCINPGATDTGYAPGAPGIWGRPDDAGRLVAWLLSEDGRWVTGQTIVSDGGGHLG
ncbi:MAG: SDR family oxidoreductase [Candidatus Dormibacteraeota bacterium]|nr:SDR family oxidoreductase [Candidatus Dormibacteraeota bacterium]